MFRALRKMQFIKLKRNSRKIVDEIVDFQTEIASHPEGMIPMLFNATPMSETFKKSQMSEFFDVSAGCFRVVLCQLQKFCMPHKF